jgi:hypothetical protein
MERVRSKAGMTESQESRKTNVELEFGRPFLFVFDLDLSAT